MSPVASPQLQLSSRQVSAAAENIAAAQFSLYGFDVLEQAGQARFVYDLGVAKSGGMMKVMVHGSLDGLWELVEPYLERTPRHAPTIPTGRVGLCLTRTKDARPILRERDLVMRESPQPTRDRGAAPTRRPAEIS